jgi:thiol:disulfide interchange protein DsbD
MLSAMGLVVLLGIASARVCANAADNDSSFSGDFEKKSLLDNVKIDSPTAARASPKFLPVDQAFKLMGEVKDSKLVLDFQVTPGYYLYQHKFGVTADTSATKIIELVYSRPAQVKDDPEFGKVPVYHEDVSLSVPYSGGGKVTVRWQGCAEAGLCYPPQSREFVLPVRQSSAAATPPSLSSTNNPLLNSTGLLNGAGSGNTLGVANAAKGAEPVKSTPVVPMISGRPDIRTSIEKSAGVQSILIPLPSPNSDLDAYYGVQPLVRRNAARPQQTIAPPVPATPIDQEPSIPLNIIAPALSSSFEPAEQPSIDAITSNVSQPPGNGALAVRTATPLNRDPFGLSQHPLTAMLLLFLAGLGLAFTPCVLPMLPIVANLVARQHRQSMRHGLLLSGAYAIGVATCYAVLGAIIATFGQQFNLLGWLQNPLVLVIFAAIFAVLALASFDVYTLRLPHALQNKLDGLSQREHSRFGFLRPGSVLGSGLTGFVSALVVSPCVSAPLAGVLLSVSTVGNPFLGAAALFMLGLGLGVPLMILGATEGRFLPKAGDWLNWVRQGFGLLLLGVSLVLLGRVFDNALVLFVWAVLSMAFAVWFWRWQGRGKFVTQVLAFIVFAWGLLQLAGVAAGQSDPWHPLLGLRKQAAVTTPQQATPVIHSMAELKAMQQQHTRLLVDVYADWCVSCRIMERELFSGQNIPNLSTWTRVKLDVTESNSDSKDVLTQLNVFGPPVLIFYQQGVEVSRVVGEVKQTEFERVLAEF